MLKVNKELPELLEMQRVIFFMRHPHLIMQDLKREFASLHVDLDTYRQGRIKGKRKC